MALSTIKTKRGATKPKQVQEEPGGAETGNVARKADKLKRSAQGFWAGMTDYFPRRIIRKRQAWESSLEAGSQDNKQGASPETLGTGYKRTNDCHKQ